MIDGTSDAIYAKDEQGRYLMFNRAAERITGKAAADALGLDDFSLFPPEEAAMVMAGDRKVIEGGATTTYEEVVTTADGSQRTFLTAKGPLLDASGKPCGLFGVARDITERKRAAEALRESEEKHRTILQTAMDGFWLTDTQGHLLKVNEAYCRMSGYSAQELLALRVPGLEAKETASDTAARIQRTMARGEDRFESRHRRKDGSVFDVEVSVQYRPAEGGRFVVFLRDITERKLTEAARRESEEQYRDLFEWSSDALFPIATDTGRIVEANRMASELYGYDRGRCSCARCWKSISRIRRIRTGPGRVGLRHSRLSHGAARPRRR